jgi:hypothetical protein
MSEKKSLFGFLKRWGSGTDLKNEEQNETNHFEYARSQTLEKSPLKSDTVITQQMELFCVDLLSQLLKKSQFSGNVRAKKSDGNKIHIEISDSGEDMGRLIGKSGATLEALQVLLRGFVSRKFGVNVRVAVDAGEYKSKRFSKVKSNALKAAESVMKNGRKITLEPMSAADRRAVHVLFEKDKNIQTLSEGEGNERRVSLVRRHSSGF